MREYIMAACDLHEASMTLKVAIGTGPAETWRYDNSKTARKKLIARLKELSKRRKGMSILFAYEACGLGYYVRDDMVKAGIRCLVLPSSALPKDSKSKLNKTDEKDAEGILKALRSMQGGEPLKEVWVPPTELRADRDLIRARVDAAEKLAAIRVQIRSLFKRAGARCKGTTSQEHRDWLKGQLRKLPGGSALTLGTLLRQMEFYEREVAELDVQVSTLARSARYGRLVAALCQETGVGELVAMVFLAEMGDCLRFTNRRKVGSYLGLVPVTKESGEADDRKGHITRQGPPVVRKMLCQAVWCQKRCDPVAKARYEHLVRRNPKHKKIAVVAMMRQLSIRLWHRAVQVLQEQPRPVAVPALKTRAPRFAASS